MCVAVPVLVEEVLPDDMLRGRVGGGETHIHLSSLLLPEPVQAGDYVIMHAGFALHRVSPEDAAESLAILRQMAGLATPEENT